MDRERMRAALPIAALALLAASCFSGHAETREEDPLRVRRGTFRNVLVLTGELDAARGEMITVPMLPNWQSSVKWLVTDGTEVKEGDRIIELDNSSFANDLDAKRETELQSLQELQQREEEWKAAAEQRRLDFDKRKSELEKAKIDAAVPRDILSAREYEDRQTALSRASVEYEKARDLVRSQQAGIASDRANIELRIGKAEREIRRSEEAIRSLVLRAPRAGVVVIRDHPWEGRKLEAGDTVFVGMPLALIPELGSLQVSASLADVDDGRVAEGMPVTVTLDGYPALHFGGSVASISAVAQESARQSLRRAFRVFVKLDRIDAARMRPGLSARVEIVRANRPGVLMAPRAALETGAKPKARLSSGRLVEVKLEECNAQECVVASGLTEGQRLASLDGGTNVGR